MSADIEPWSASVFEEKLREQHSILDLPEETRANADAMRSVRARHRNADLILYPELQLIGYPPEDLVLKPALIERAGDELLRLARATGDGGPAMLVGAGLVLVGAALALALLRSHDLHRDCDVDLSRDDS